jgi:hypothetical protein
LGEIDGRQEELRPNRTVGHNACDSYRRSVQFQYVSDPKFPTAIDDPIPEVPKTFLVTEGAGPARLQEVRETWDAWSAWDLGELVRDLAVQSVPLAYFVYAGSILSVGNPTSGQAFSELHEAALKRLEERSGVPTGELIGK